MSELRKPCFTFLLRKQGKRKTSKVEIFNANLWEDGQRYRNGKRSERYRLRVNGKWFYWDKKEKAGKYFSRTVIRDLLWRSIRF